MASATYRRMRNSIEALGSTLAAIKSRTERAADQWAGDSTNAKLPDHLAVNARFARVPDAKIEEYTSSMRHTIKQIHEDLQAIDELTGRIYCNIGSLEHCNERLHRMTEDGGRG